MPKAGLTDPALKDIICSILEKGMGMKRIFLRIGGLAILIGALVLLQHRLENLEGTVWTTYDLVFHPPLGPHAQEKQAGDTRLEAGNISQVYLAGALNDWQPDNPAYRMLPDPDGTWSIQVRLSPGKNLYKYVVYLKDRDQPVWLHDSHNPLREDDNFGGYNSVVKIRNPRLFCRVMWYAVLVVLFFYGIFLLLDLISFLVFRYRLGMKAKIAMMVLTVSILAMTVNNLYNIYQQRILARESILDSLNLVHLYIQGSGIDLQGRFSEATLPQLADLFKRFFYPARARIQRNVPSNQQIFLSTFLFFDAEGRVIQVYKRREGQSLSEESMAKLGYQDMKDYYQNFVFRDLLSHLKKYPEKRFQAQFGHLPQAMNPYISPLDRLSARMLGFKIVLQPVFENQNLVGYYGATLHTLVYGSTILSLMVFNLLTGVAVALFMLVYFLFFHKDPSQDYLFERFFIRFQISKREQDVVKLLCMGYSNQEISERLFISEGTVKSHIHHVFQKAHVAQRLELITLIKSLT